MNRLMSLLCDLSDGLNRLAISVATGCMLAMVAIVMFQVVARYVFASPPFWTEELGRWLMVWGGLLGASAAFKFYADPSFVSAPKDELRQRLEVLARLVGAWLFLVPIIYFSGEFVQRQIDRPSEGLGISTAWLAASLPLAAGLICFHSLAAVAGLLAGRSAAPRFSEEPSMLQQEELT